MARRKDDMTPEEQAAMKERMLELRQMAHKKIAERTAAKREAEAIVKKAREDREINDVEKAKKVLAEIEEERRLAAEEDAAKAAAKAAKAQSEAAAAETLPPVPPKKLKKPLESDSSDDDTAYKAFMKEKLKAKYETKYRMKYAQPQQAPPPPPQLAPPANPVTETARDALKNRVTDEVRRMAMASLFGGGGWQ